MKLLIVGVVLASLVVIGLLVLWIINRPTVARAKFRSMLAQNTQLEIDLRKKDDLISEVFEIAREHDDLDHPMSMLIVSKISTARAADLKRQLERNL